MEQMCLKVLPADAADIGTQRCRLGPKAMMHLGLHIGSAVEIHVPGGSYLCSSWPRSDLTEGFLQFDRMCAKEDTHLHAHQNLHVSLSQIKPLTCPKVKTVQVNVVVKTMAFKTTNQMHIIHDLVKDMLRGTYVSVQHVVDLSRFKTQIELVTVESFNPCSSEAGLITAKTGVDISEVRTLSKYRNQKEKTSRTTMGGIDDVYASLKEVMSLPLFYPETLQKLGLACPKGILLIGPPGVGKTMLVKSVVKEFGATLITINGPMIWGSRPGESEENLREMFQRAREASQEGPCVLFIDEVDSMCPKRSASSAANENRVVAQLLTLMDGIGSRRRFVVVGATNRPDALDPALRRPGRFDREVILGVPTLSQRKSILDVLGCRMTLACDVDFTTLAEMTAGFVGADLSALCREAAMRAIRCTAQDGERETIDMKHFLSALKNVQPSCLRSSIGLTDFKPIAWDQVGGLEDVKLKLKQSIEWPMKFPEAFVRLGLPRPRGILLYGPPGCAKTTLVKAAATSSHCAFLTASGADLYSPFVGDSEKALAQVFQQARACAPSVLFLDEVDTLLGSREDSRSTHSIAARVLSVLLNEMDGVALKTTERRGMERVKCLEDNSTDLHRDQQMAYQEVCNKDVMIVAATNRPDALDSALLRPGRIDKIIYVPPPDLEARLAILHICARRMPLDCDVSLRELAEQTNLFSGADLENLCKEAALLTLEEEGMDTVSVKNKFFQKALQSMMPSLKPLQLLSYQNLFM